VTGTEVEVAGRVVTDTGGQVEYWVEYGPTAAYGEVTDSGFVTLAKNEVYGVGVNITGLERSKTYHYRLCAKDANQNGGPGCGEDNAFLTQMFDCGDTITRDVRMRESMDCDRGPDSNGLTIGADGVQVDLGGFTLHGPHGLIREPVTPIGIDNSAGYDDVTIRNGGLAYWGTGVRMEGGSRNWFLDASVTSNTRGLVMRGGDHNLIMRSTLAGSPGFGLGLTVVNSPVLVVDGGAGAGWLVDSNDTLIRRSALQPTEDASEPCIEIRGSRNRVVDNGFVGCIRAGLVVTSGADNVLTSNDIEGFSSPGDPAAPGYLGDGIFVGAFTAGTVLRENVVYENSGDGIEALAPATSLQGNSADDNGDFGIDAAAGSTDLGGNSAEGNGNPLQCRNVFCS
jgi:hypothetical protein